MPNDVAPPAPRRIVPTVLGLLLLALMGFLLLHGPRLVAESSDGDVAVSCGSILTVGWPTDHSDLDTETARSYGDHVRSGDPDFVGREGIARDCSERRDTYLGFVAVLAVPTSVCLSRALGAPRVVQAV